MVLKHVYSVTWSEPCCRTPYALDSLFHNLLVHTGSFLQPISALVLGRIITPQRTRTCGYITILYGKRDLADVIQLKTLRWEMTLDCLGGPSIITEVHQSVIERQKVSIREDVTIEERLRERWCYQLPALQASN